MLVQLTYVDNVLVSQSPFLRLSEQLSLQLFVCEHSQSVPHSVLVFQMLFSLLLVYRGLVGVSDAVVLSLPREWKIAFLSWQSGVTDWNFLVHVVLNR